MRSTDGVGGTLQEDPPPAPQGADGPPTRGKKPAAAWTSRPSAVHIGRAVVLLLVLGLWWAADRWWVNPLFFTSPQETAVRLVTLLTEGEFWRDVAVTLREVALGWAIGSTAGLVVGMLLGRYHYGAKVFGPFLTFFNSTPKAAYAPLIIVWFGIGEPSKIVLATIMAFFIVRLPTQSAVELLDPDLDRVATTMGATETQKFFTVVLPGILAAVFGALRLAAVYSLLAVVMAEILASYFGLGQRLIYASNVYDMSTAFAVIIVLAAIAMGLNGLVRLVESRLMSWRTSAASNETVSV